MYLTNESIQELYSRYIKHAYNIKIYHILGHFTTLYADILRVRTLSARVCGLCPLGCADSSRWADLVRLGGRTPLGGRTLSARRADVVGVRTF